MLLVPQSIIIPISLSMGMLSLGLIRYYSTSNDDIVNTQNRNNHLGENAKNNNQKEIRINSNDFNRNTIFVFVFIVAIVISAFFTSPEVDHVYKNWHIIGIKEVIGLGAGIVLTFFLPGYSALLLLTRNYEINPVLKVLLAYLLSMMITGVTVYLSEMFFDNNVALNKTLILVINVSLLVSVFIYYRTYRVNYSVNSDFHYLISSSSSNVMKILKFHNSEFIVFGSLFTILIICTNYLYGGITIGDQWYHQNRAMLFMSGQFKEFVLTNGDEIYPPLQSALLAGLTTISGTPIVNTFASIAFLNITAVFAFYFFCSAWFPRDSKKAALFAASLFLISSGFGWIYIISLEGTNPIDSQIESIATFVEDKIKVTDIRLSANFMIAAFPDFSTALVYISLPAGFVLLGLVRVAIDNRFRYMILLLLVTILGVLSHDEFYIFIILASLLPLIYNIQKKNYLYIGLLITFALTYAVDSISPENYFTFQNIFGMPLLQLCTIFTSFMFSLYLLRQRFTKRLSISFSSIVLAKRVFTYLRRIHLIPKLVLVGSVVYLYLLCFIVWDQLPPDILDVHTQKYNTPWYLYPMRLGIIGLIGLASILSYAFKKYEKVVFVFGILIAIALLAGPYYNEQRFNKYVMAGMIGFAAFLLFKLVNYIKEKKPALNGIIVSTIILTASLSTLMYVGYNALVIQTQDYTHALDRRDFPSEEDLRMFDMLRSNIQLGPNPYNIVSFSNEYNFREGGIMSKLHAFTGLPYAKISRTGYLLNASSLELFYQLLGNSNTKYILIPSKSINSQSIDGPMRFALENFQQIYQNDNYTVIKVPQLHGPSTSKSEIGIIYLKDKLSLSELLHERQLNVSNSTFTLKANDLKFIDTDSKNKNTVLNAYKKNGGKTIWSTEFGESELNYIDFRFRILGENKTGKDSAGLRWIEGGTTYFVTLTNNGLELRRQLSNEDNNVLLAQNSEVKKKDWIGYSIKIRILENSINIFVDNLLKMKTQRIPSEHAIGISKIGIFSENNAVEFDPIILANINSSETFYNIRDNYDNYYPISSLALSPSRYDTFLADDYSVLSKKTIVIPFDSPDWNDIQFNRYLDYARTGGTLVIINSNNSVEGKFAKMLLLQNFSNTTEKFTGIQMDGNQNAFLNISGNTRNLKINPELGFHILGRYVSTETNQSHPFVIEKKIDDGRIIYINAKGYFDAINNDPMKYFSSLSSLPDILVPYSSNQTISQSTSKPIKRFIGDLEMNGKISINASSIMIINGSMDLPGFKAKTVSVFDKYGKLENHFENLSILNAITSGSYEISIETSGAMTLPEGLSQRDYVQMSIPNEFNLTLTLLDNKTSHAEFPFMNNSAIDVLEFANESRIIFTSVKAPIPLESVSFLMKNPIISVDGDIRFDKTNFHGESTNPPLNVAGSAVVGFDFIDDFEELYRKGIRTQHLSYLGSISIDDEIKQSNRELKLPGDISVDVRKRGLDVPLHSILGTSNNFALIVAVSIGTIIVTWLIRRTDFH